MRRIGSFVGQIFRGLFRFGGEKIGGWGIVVVLMMDIFILYVALLGIAHYQSKIDAPWVKFPPSCHEAFMHPDNIERYSFLYRQPLPPNSAPLCKEALKKLHAIFTDPAYITYTKKRNNLQTQLQSTKSQLIALKQRYDTSLLEKIAQEPQSEQLQNRYKALLRQRDYYQKSLQLLQNPLAARIASVKTWLKEHQKEYLAAKKRYERWYFLVHFWDLLKFVAPLLLLFGFILFKTRDASKKYTQMLHFGAKHIIAVLLIPVVWELFRLLYMIIPFRFLDKLLEIFAKLNLYALAYYILIIAALLVGSYSLYWLVKKQKIYDRAKRIKNIKRRKIAALNGSFCIGCRSKVDYAREEYCKVCGKRLLGSCRYCKAPLPLIALHCPKCGKPN